jgi:hypothetical protein
MDVFPVPDGAESTMNREDLAEWADPAAPCFSDSFKILHLFPYLCQFTFYFNHLL